LEQRKDEIKDELKNGSKNEKLLIEIKEVNDSINWLKKINELKLKNVQKYEIIELPDMKTGWSFYRIMNDCETDDRNDWIELNIPAEMCMGDILIISKP
jgi:hypothetical protein